MYVSVTDNDKKTVHTHTSLISEESAAQIQQLYDTQATWRGRGASVATYLGLEAVNRIALLSKQPFLRKAAIVGAFALVGGVAGSQGYWRTTGDAELKKLLAGAPVFENKFDVPELDKLYFFLDDDNNYEPSLHHHGISKPQKLTKFFTQ